MIKTTLAQLTILITFIIANQSFADTNNIAHAIAMHGSPKYDTNFNHVDYVNPNAERA